MEVVSKKSFLELLESQSIFDYSEFKGSQGEIILGLKDNIRYLDLSLEQPNYNELNQYLNKENTLIKWVINILQVNTLKKMYIHPPEGKWLRGKSTDPEFLHAKNLLKTYSLKNSFTGGISFFPSGKKEFEDFLKIFSINAFRSNCDVIFLLICEKVSFVLAPCDHFDYHIYPSNVEQFISIAQKLLPSPEFTFTSKTN
ncbi:MAG: hypothetical protein M0021_00755 [Clostridia bacterium]|nr:hypothetical protein [Clostridia bacterium]